MPQVKVNHNRLIDHYTQCCSIYRCFATVTASFNTCMSAHFELQHKKTQHERRGGTHASDVSQRFSSVVLRFLAPQHRKISFCQRAQCTVVFCLDVFFLKHTIMHTNCCHFGCLSLNKIEENARCYQLLLESDSAGLNIAPSYNVRAVQNIVITSLCYYFHQKW